MAYSILELLPWEFEKLTILEFEKLVEGYELRMRERDAKTAFFSTMMTNIHIPKESDRIKVSDVMKVLYPPTPEDKEREEELFIREWQEEGGEIDGRKHD